MNNTLFDLNLSHYNTKFINELKYKVHQYPKKYTLKISQKVEGIFIQILLKNMRNTLEKNNLFDSNQSRLYTEIYDQKISMEMAKKGIGLTKILLQQIKNSKNISNINSNN